ncbi:competence protein CoiA family protein, partial [Oleiphilus sp. HI0066]
MTLIPFAINPENRYVEVSQVPSGRKCNCVCPSCKQPVLARKGAKKEWHFSHDPNPETPPEKECELSFEVCCRQYLEQIMLEGTVNALCTPAYYVAHTCEETWQTTARAEVTQSRTLSSLSFKKSDHTDLVSQIGDYEILVFISYPERVRPENPKSKSSALLEIDITWVRHKYYSQDNDLTLTELLLHFMHESSENKYWLYHPNEGHVKAQLKYDYEMDKWKQAEEERQFMVHIEQRFALTHIPSNKNHLQNESQYHTTSLSPTNKKPNRHCLK